jgi:hypothetical protein
LFAHAEVNAVIATNNPVARSIGPAAEKRMTTDLAPPPPLPPRQGQRPLAECDPGGVLFEQMGGPQSHLPRNARH